MTSPLYTCRVACATCKKELGAIVNATIEALVTTPDGEPANLRREPHEFADVLAHVPVNAALPLMGAQSGAWMPVEWNGVAGWMRADLVRLDSEATRTAPTIAACPGHTVNTNIALSWEAQAGVVRAAPPAEAVPAPAPAPPSEKAEEAAPAVIVGDEVADASPPIEAVVNGAGSSPEIEASLS